MTKNTENKIGLKCCGSYIQMTHSRKRDLEIGIQREREREGEQKLHASASKCKEIIPAVPNTYHS